MAFRIKDLLINVLAPSNERGDCDDPSWPECGCTATVWCGCSKTPPWPTCHCTRTVFCGCSQAPAWHEYLVAPNCLGTPTPGRIPATEPAIAAKQLAILKTQLKQALAEIEEQEKRLEEELQPKTVEEVEALQVKLREAADELEHRKSELKKNSF